MTLSDMRDYVESLAIAGQVYMGKLDAKKDKSIGVYSSKREHLYRTTLGGISNESYGTKYVTLLVHWNTSPRDTETAAMRLYETLRGTREVTVNKQKIKFIQPLVNEPVNIDTDDFGIYEMVIEAAVIYCKEGK